MVISMLKIRRPSGRLIFNMGIAIPGKTVFLIETAPWCLCNWAMVTPVKYEYDPDDIPNEELTERGPPLLTWINFYPTMDK